MPLEIPDELLHAAAMSEQEAKIEIACCWFDAGKLTLGHAARLAGRSELEFESQLERRGLPRYHYTEEMLDQDVQTLKKLGQRQAAALKMKEALPEFGDRDDNGKDEN
jgi:predicted HTH domain antitoxin